MNDALNIAWLNLQGKLSALNTTLANEIITNVKAIVEMEQKNVKNLQLLEVKAYHLIKGDIIFDLSNKTLHKIQYCEYRKNCQFNIKKENKEILVSYGDDIPCDYFEEMSDLYILVDIGEIANIKNRPEPEWEDH